MTREENVFLAKRALIDNIYRSAKLEGIAVTFAQTIDIVENNVVNLKPTTITDVVNLKNSWQYVLENLDSELHLGTIKDVHSIIGRGIVPYNEIGEFRTSGVLISGTSWRPSEPNVEKLHRELLDIKSINDVVERAIFLFCWVMRSQMFRDGNKRVANLIANFELIKNGAGIISVPEDKISEFKLHLIDFYESNDLTNIRRFILDKSFCADLEFLTQEEKRKNVENVPLSDFNLFSKDNIDVQLAKNKMRDMNIDRSYND